MRAVVASLLLLVGCGPSFGTMRKLGPHTAAVQVQTARPVEVVTFVAPFDVTSRRQIGARHALRLANQDWLASLGTIVRLSPSGEPRWSKPINGQAAVETPTGVVVVDRIQDRAPPQTQSITSFDIATGREQWTLQPQHAIGYTVRALRAGNATVIATERGAAGIADDGKLLWETPHKSDGVFATVVGNDAVVIATSDNAIMSREVAEGIKQKYLCHARIVEARTGTTRASVDISPEAHGCAAWGLAVTSRGAIALRIADVRYRFDNNTISQTAKDRILVLDPRDLTTTATIAVPKTPPTVASIHVGLDDATFLGTYAAGGETLDLVLVDVVRREIRKATIFTSAREHSYIQLMTVDIAPTQITFAGQFTGALRMPKGASIRSDVREVDACDAAGGIECSHGARMTTAAPVAGVIGAITIGRK